MTIQPHDQAGLDLGVIQALVDEHFPFDCSPIEIDPHTWAIHGSIPVGGEAILAEFANKADAEAALELLSAAEKQTETPSSRDWGLSGASATTRRSTP